MADWRAEAAQAVEAELEHLRGDGGWLVLGKVRRLPEPGWYATDLRGRWIGRDNLVRLCVAGAAGGLSVPVAESRVVAGVLRLRVAGPLPSGCDRAWAEVRSPRELRRRVAESLRRIDHAPLADQLAQGRLDPVLDGAVPPGCTEQQAAAYRACRTPGLHLVLAPPGTGVTHVLTRAATDLAEAGKSVLIVSGDHQLAKRFAPEDTESDPELGVVLEDLAELDAASARMSFMDEKLAGYDHEAFQVLAARIDHEDRIEELEAELAETLERHKSGAAELEAAQSALRAARAERGRVDYERKQLEKAAEFAKRITELAPEGRNLSRRKPGDRRVLREVARLTALAEEHLHAALPITEDDLERLDDQLVEAENALDEAARDESDAYLKGEALRRKILQARAVGPVSEEDRDLHAAQAGLPALYEEREELRRTAEERGLRRERLESRLLWLTEQALLRGKEIADEAKLSAPVVVAGHLEACTDSAITRRLFDAVLIEQAAASRLADLLPAVALADGTAVLFGDFRQAGPEVRPSRLTEDPAVKTWLATDVFVHCGRSAVQETGVVLSEQFTGGPGTRALANAVSYGDLTGDRGEAEVVLLDTGALPELARPHLRATGWSPIVGLLAGKLTETHGRQGNSFGLMTAYQQRLPVCLAAVRDGDPSLSAAVGTARSLSGQRFDAAALDLTNATDATLRALLTTGAMGVRDRLYLLADLEKVKSAPIGSALGVLNALRLQQSIEVRPAAEPLNPVNAAEVADALARARESAWLWAPWSEDEVPGLVAAITAAIGRGVEVNAVLRPDGSPLIRSLRGAGARIVRARTAHRKVAVVDRRTVIFGATSFPLQGDREELVVIRDSPRFARRLLVDLPTEEDRYEAEVPSPRTDQRPVRAHR